MYLKEGRPGRSHYMRCKQKATYGVWYLMKNLEALCQLRTGGQCRECSQHIANIKLLLFVTLGTDLQQRDSPTCGAESNSKVVRPCGSECIK